MIKPEELRIGNILKSHLTGVIVVTDWLVIKHVCDGNLQSVYDNRPVYEPIHLTEELLVKAGFENIVKEAYSLGHKKEYNVFRKGHYVYNSLQAQWWYNSTIMIKQPEYFHELQNHWYVNTGTELTIKL